MGVHILPKGEKVSELVLLPGDPMRAKFIAENYLENAVCYNKVRGMLGFTGTYKGTKVSVQGTGMGVPSIQIYVHELINDWGAKKLIRIGSCGSFQDYVKMGSLVLAMASSTNSSMNKLRFGGMDYAPTADWQLLKRAYDVCEQKKVDVNVGNVFCSDTFYEDEPSVWKHWAKFGCLCIDMESTALYTLAAKFGVQALTMLTVSDSLVTGEADDPDSREQTYTNMMEVALKTITSG